MITGPDAFYVVAKTLLTEAADGLATTAAGRPDRVCVVPGDVAWDECECGQLAATIARWFYTEDFPDEQGEAQFTPCEAPFIVAEMFFNVTRCAPQPVGDSVAPTCAELDAAALESIIDAHVVRTKISCKLTDMKRDDDVVDFLVRRQTSVGPAGMCVGSQLEVLVALDR